MKNKISTILLIEIILGILIFVINAIMQKFDWQLRSWLLTVAFFVLHTGIIGFSIVSVLTINSKIKRYIFLFIWILICAGVFFINLMFFCIGIKADYIEKIDGQKLKQNFSLKVTNVARTAHEGKINSIPTSLRNKTTEWVKKKLEDIADYIEDYSYKNNTFPVGFENNLLIQLYSEVVDLYMQNPKSEISVKQYETYKKFARIVNQSVSSKGE